MENWGREACQVLLYYPLSEPKGAANEGQEQGVWKQRMERTGYFAVQGEDEGESFRGTRMAVGESVGSGALRTEEFSRLRAEMVMTGLPSPLS